LWPNELVEGDLVDFTTTDAIYEFTMAQGVAFYAEREAEIGVDAMRQIERQVMLRIIDQRWREHLYEMDYLKECIHLRAMGQKDPLTEWQREGFEMFGVMMASIAQDFVKYITHIQVNDESEQAPAKDEAVATDVEESGPEPGSDGVASMAAAAAASPETAAKVTAAVDDAPKIVEENVVSSRTPIVKSEMEKTPRNAPCPCGSGKKFKQCHGK